MLTKTCDKCGAVYPWDSSVRKCKVCSEYIKMGQCITCGKFDKMYTHRYNICRECRNAFNAKSRSKNHRKNKAIAQSRYDVWKDKISKISSKYPTLTEAQWLEACSYFGGCALCASTSIDSRGFLIPFKEGGRYCDWNVIPLCERCAASLKKQPNPFSRLDYIINRNAEVAQKQYAEKVYAYLERRLDNAVAKSQD